MPISCDCFTSPSCSTFWISVDSPLDSRSTFTAISNHLIKSFGDNSLGSSDLIRSKILFWNIIACFACRSAIFFRSSACWRRYSLSIYSSYCRHLSTQLCLALQRESRVVDLPNFLETFDKLLSAPMSLYILNASYAFLDSPFCLSHTSAISLTTQIFHR